MKFKLNVENFSLYYTLYSGQCFRFYKTSENKFLVFAGLNSTYVWQKEKCLFFEKSSCCSEFWKKYFNLNIDYNLFYKRFKGDRILEKLLKKYKGIRILKQDPFECLISFILSSNNNIKRIQKIIEIICENFGEKNKNGFSFPKIEVLSHLKEKDFEILKAGFRVKYLMDAIYKIKNKEVDLKKLQNLSYEEAKEVLKKIKGVGEKVSNCVLLFSYNKMEAFPVDVWIKKVLDEYYRNGLTKQILSCPGLAQQFLFYGKRNEYI